jgi:hypothetical protein
VSRVAEQIAAYCVSALVAGTMFFRWWRLDKDDKQRVWLLYGWYSGLMVCGSCVGSVTWAARMMNLMNLFKGEDAQSKRNFIEGFSFLALARSWRAVFLVAYAIEFMCLSAAKLLVLDRMSDIATPGEEGKRQRWVAGGRIVMAFIVFGNAVGLVANVAAAVYLQKSSEAYSAASASLIVNNTNAADEYAQSARDNSQRALSILSVQSFSEVVVLLLTVAAFIVVGVLCARVVSSALTILDNAGPEMAAVMMLRKRAVGAAKALGRQMRQEVVVTTAFVFVAFLLRSVVSTMLALAFKFQDYGNFCPGVFSLCDASCYNQYTHIVQWNAYTPEFVSTVVLISSPLTLLVALWSITSKYTLQLMRS